MNIFYIILIAMGVIIGGYLLNINRNNRTNRNNRINKKKTTIKKNKSKEKSKSSVIQPKESSIPSFANPGQLFSKPLLDTIEEVSNETDSNNVLNDNDSIVSDFKEVEIESVTSDDYSLLN